MRQRFVYHPLTQKSIPAVGRPLIHLSWIARLYLLQLLFDEILVAPALYSEVLTVIQEFSGNDKRRHPRSAR